MVLVFCTEGDSLMQSKYRKKNQSEAQKRAYSKYSSNKTKSVSLIFSPKTMHRYNQLKEYTKKNGKSINGFIIELISEFFDNGHDKKERMQVQETIPKNLNDEYSRLYREHIYNEDIEYLNEHFGSSTTEKILVNLYEIMESYLNDIIETYGNDFTDWVEDISDRIEGDDDENDKIDAENILEDMFKHIT